MVPKVLILFWKNLLIRKNHPAVTALEIVVPVIFVILGNVLIPNPDKVRDDDKTDKDPLFFPQAPNEQCNFNHFRYGNIIYEPSTPFTDKLMSEAACYAGYKKTNVRPGKLDDSSLNFLIAVKFMLNDSSDIVPDVLNYRLYPKNRAWVNLKTLWDQEGPPFPKYSILSTHNVVQLQRAIDTSYLSMKNVTASKVIMLNTDFFHIGSFIFLTTFVYTAIFLEIIFMLPPIINRVVQEKYTGAKELMLMMGVKKIDIWVAKFFDAYFIQMITVTAMVVFLYVPLTNDSISLQNNPMYLWGIIMFGFIGIIIFLFLLSCFFQQTTMAIFISGSFWVITFLVDNYLLLNSSIPGYVVYITCLLPHTALINAVFILLQFEILGKPVSFTENVTKKRHLPVLYEICLIMLLNIFIYGILTWYFENIYPGKYGIPKPLNFFFKKSFWVQRKVDTFQENLYSNSERRDDFEPVPANLEVAIKVQNVTKIYKFVLAENVVAVDNVSLNFYKGEISGLLGHNSAGKTTLFSMITGLTYPTNGKIYVNGYDTASSIDKARESLGLCPQKDMLFDDLNPMQILKFYGAIKGLSLKQAEREAYELIKTLKLTSVKNTKSAKLSGGQKRKVSLAIALIGGSQVLILDEPTSGMDPEIRREIWELLLKYRGQRSVLLTTHFMDEADALCDRVAIMDSGKVKCYGSPMFLKSKFGRGYVLNIVLLEAEQSLKITDFVKLFVPTARLKAQNIRTLSFELPDNKVDAFPSLLSGLEQKQQNNEIISYSINIASLEEVFLNLKSGQDGFDAVDAPGYATLDYTEEPSLSKVTGFSLYFQQFWTLLLKKFTVFRKSYLTLLAFIIFPAAIVVINAFLSRDNSPYDNEDYPEDEETDLSYSLSLYKPSLVLYRSQDDPYIKEAFKNYVESFGIATQETQNLTGAIYETFQKNFYFYSKILNLGVEFLPNEIKAYHNQNAVHMVPVALNLIHNVLLKLSKQNGSIVTSVDSTFATKEFYPLAQKIHFTTSINDITDYGGTHVFFYLIGPVQENFHGAKQLQLMVTTTFMYWLTHLIYDIFCFYLYVVLLYVILGACQSNNTLFDHPVEVLSGILLWGIGLILICYVISTFLKKLVGAFTVKVLIYISCVFVLYYLVILGGAPEYVQYFHPSLMLKFGIQHLSENGKRDFIWILFLYDVGLFIILILKDSGFMSFIWHRFLNKIMSVNYYNPRERMEELVQRNESSVRSIVKSKVRSDHVLIAYKLKRWYFRRFRPRPAVRGVSFAVSKGECFGLLGVNGAGKTSTFKMLTGDITPSGGKVYISATKLSVFTRQKSLFGIGYCPQFGGLIPIFNGKEMLQFFGRMRGIRNSNLNEQVLKWLSKLGLLELSKKRCGNYSGGNQRKLTTGISLIGDSPVIFLDEPTTGVDPVSRRSIWNLIAEVQKNGQSIILTSHSMDECEALCSRVAIMVEGKFRCIGETPTLKDKYGKGYSVRLKVEPNTSESNINDLKKAFTSSFQESSLVDEHLTILQYKVTNKYTSADVFKKLMDLKKKFSFLESYSASAATLEQIFIDFAREK